MSRDLQLAVSVTVSDDTEMSYCVDPDNDDATFTIIGAYGLESYLMLDAGALQRFHQLSGEALDKLRAEHAGQ
jgi:hypothetical protein